jgi:hypothetical protein
MIRRHHARMPLATSVRQCATLAYQTIRSESATTSRRPLSTSHLYVSFARARLSQFRIFSPIVIALCAALAGCSEEEALDNCKRQVEQTVLLRQLALPPQEKTKLDTCLWMNMPPEWCRAVSMQAISSILPHLSRPQALSFYADDVATQCPHNFVIRHARQPR